MPSYRYGSQCVAYGAPIGESVLAEGLSSGDSALHRAWKEMVPGGAVGPRHEGLRYAA
jgi:hypothetical protein